MDHMKSLREQYAPGTADAGDNLGSNGSNESSEGTSSQAGESPSRESSARTQEGVKDILRRHELAFESWTTHGKGGAPTAVKHDNGGWPPNSRSWPSAGLPPASKGSAHHTRKEFSEIPSAAKTQNGGSTESSPSPPRDHPTKTSHRVSKIAELSPSFSKDYHSKTHHRVSDTTELPPRSPQDYATKTYHRESDVTELSPSPPKDYLTSQHEDEAQTMEPVRKQMESRASAKGNNRTRPSADDDYQGYSDVLRASSLDTGAILGVSNPSHAAASRRHTSSQTTWSNNSSGPRTADQSESGYSTTASSVAHRRRLHGRHSDSSRSNAKPRSSRSNGFSEFEYSAVFDSRAAHSSGSEWHGEELRISASRSRDAARHDVVTRAATEFEPVVDGGRLSYPRTSSRRGSAPHESNGNSALVTYGAASRGSPGRASSQTLELVKYAGPDSIAARSNRRVKWLLKGVAAASYNGGWLPYDEMVPFPDDVADLNTFLDQCWSEVEAGLPGRFLTVVLGSAMADLDSIVSTITYAYFLSSTVHGSKGGEQSQVFIPVLNMHQEDLVLCTEAVWLFKITGLDTSKLLFVNQISLQYYHRFGNLQLVLVDHSRLAPHQEMLEEAVIGIVDHKFIDNIYPWVPSKDIQLVGSCCTIIAGRYASEAPERLTARGIKRLLLAPILLNTANLDPKSVRCTDKDMWMAALLINGAGRYGQQGFFRLLRKSKFEVSTLTTLEMLRKDFKQWTLGPGKSDTYGLRGRTLTAAMSTLGLPLKDIITRDGIIEDLKFFKRMFKLDLLMIITGYYDSTDRYKREILLVPRDMELMRHLRACFRPHREDLKLSQILVPGLPEEMLLFKQGLVTASRTILEQILRDYFEM